MHEAHDFLSSTSEKYELAGKIARGVKKEIESREWAGKSYVELCTFVENEIKLKGGSPAFPVNVCANESAAHYTAEIEDSSIVQNNDLLKVDIGVQIDGYIADTAVTLCYNESLLDMTEATRSALGEAIKGIKQGVKTGDIGKIVERYAARRGYLPIENLSGHSLEQYTIHAGASIPNVWAVSNYTFKEARFYAIEPFFTTPDASGVVVEGPTRNIFGLVARKRTKDQKLNDFLDLIWDTCRTLPFAARWFSEHYSKQQIDSMTKELIKMRLVHAYPELIESRKKPVAQAEHTIEVRPSGTVVLT